MPTKKAPLPGSGRSENQDPKAKEGKIMPRSPERLMFSFVLRHAKSPEIPEGISRKEALKLFMPHDQSIQLIRKFAADHGFVIESEDMVARKVTLSGAVRDIESAFLTKLFRYEHPHGNYLSHESELHIPEELHQYVLGIIGLHRRPVHKIKAKPTPQLQAPAPPGAPKQIVFDNTPDKLAKLYDFPKGLSGKGQQIALLQLGGGYHPQDIEAYFKELKMNTPVLKDISVNGGTNNPKVDDHMRTIEVYSDIYMAGAVANDAELLIYFADDNHLHSLVDTFQAAVYDQQNAPGIISCSWGSAERNWNENDIQVLESVLEDARRLNMTVIAASGDAGSSDDAQGVNVDYPASSPWVMGCGGTVAYVDQNFDSILSEVVWNCQAGTQGASGGGVSAKLPLPKWQSAANVPTLKGPKTFKGRGVPDLSAVAGFYEIRMFGKPTKTGGTSCGAPFLAALMAMVNQQAGKNLGYVNDLLYKMKLEDQEKICHEIMMGSNGLYRAGKGWNACTGLGRPYGNAFMKALLDAKPVKSGANT